MNDLENVGGAFHSGGGPQGAVYYGDDSCAGGDTYEGGDNFGNSDNFDNGDSFDLDQFFGHNTGPDVFDIVILELALITNSTDKHKNSDRAYVLSPGPPPSTFSRYHHPSNYDHTPPASELRQEILDMSFVDQLGLNNDVVEQSQQRTAMVPRWHRGTYSGGNRLFPQSQSGMMEDDPASLFGMPTPSNTSIAESNTCQDFLLKTRPGGIKLNALEQHKRWRDELIVNVEMYGHKLQDTPRGNPSGLYALQKGLARNTPWTPTFNELHNLLVRAGFDLKGRSLPAQALWGVLVQYGARTNMQFRLGVVNGGCADPNSYDIYIYEEDTQQGDPQAKLIWLYNDNAENAILGAPDRWSATNHWSAIAPVNTNSPPSWADVVAKPAPPAPPAPQRQPPPPPQVQDSPFDKSFLYPGRVMSMSIRPKPTNPQPQDPKRGPTSRNPSGGRKPGPKKHSTKLTNAVHKPHICEVCKNEYDTSSQLT
jgi:hypothetical protein